MLNRMAATALGILLFVSALSMRMASQDDIPGKKAPSITLVDVPLTVVTRGKGGSVDLQFRIGSGFHVNSNTPTQDYLIPTALKLNPPTDIVVGRITYPVGDEMAFSFAPDEKLSVYSGAFTIGVIVRPLASVLPGKYEFRGKLKYQACDKAACYPPKELPVAFEIKVVKSPPPPRKNPAQSPHVHT
jgi:cytochrome c biogenesis DsbD-like protein